MKAEERKLLDAFRKLPRKQRETLREFADFLASRHVVESSVPVEPLAIPRPEDETVIAAIKRLSATFPMLSRDKLFHETSALMTQHVVHGRDSADIIDELEALFRRYYEAFLQDEDRV
jgi:hypothetical protein